MTPSPRSAARRIIEQCVNSGGTGPTCALYTRQADGNIETLLNTTTNIGGTKVEGYDLTVGYRLPETAWGKFSFTWDTTYLAEQDGRHRR